MIIQFNIPDAALPRLQAALPIVFHYKPELHGPPLPFFKQKTIEFWKGLLKAAEGQAAGDAARDAKNAEIDNLVIEVD